MGIFYNVVLGIAVLVAAFFTLIVFATGKGDAMSGSGGVRTTYKGKASIEDQISKLTLYLGISFMTLMIALDVIAKYSTKKG